MEEEKYYWYCAYYAKFNGDVGFSEGTGPKHPFEVQRSYLDTGYKVWALLNWKEISKDECILFQLLNNNRADAK